jgi:suppressor of fused-like protein
LNSPREPDRDPGLEAAAAYADRVAGSPAREVFSPRRAAVDQVRVYAPDGAWHLVTLGLADQGFELTLRLPRAGLPRAGLPRAGLARQDEELPTWGVDCLLSLAAYARRSGHGFADGDQVDLRGPIKLDADTAITAAAVTQDPALKMLGQVEFLQVVGLTADELELCRSWRTTAVVGLLRDRDPWLTTRLDRVSLMDDPALREVAEAGVAAEGSSLEELGVASLSWRERGRGNRRVVAVTLGSGAATALGPALRRRLTHDGAAFSVVGDTGELRFSMTGADGWRVDGDVVAIDVAAGSVEALAALFDGRTGTGSLPTLAGLRFTVIP